VVEEYADLQCPFCAAFSEQQLPGIVEDYVRTGRVRLRLRLLTFLGPDSVKGARTAKAAARQNRMWQFVEAFYADQARRTALRHRRVPARPRPPRRGRRRPRAARAQRGRDRARPDRGHRRGQGAEGREHPDLRRRPRGGDMQPVTGDDLRGAIDAAAGSAGG
jgi:hypothetical protein